MNYLSLSFFSILLFLVACTNETPTSSAPTLTKSRIEGETMGTTFLVSYFDSLDRDFSGELEELLLDFNQSVSTYESASTISQFNQADDSLIVLANSHFVRNFELAKDIYQKTDGWFNPCVMPLVNYWGFGYTEKKIVTQKDPKKIDSLLALVHFDSVNLASDEAGILYCIKQQRGLELDFSAIAKGDAVDQVGLFLEQQGILNYFVEIGGEVRARGFATATGDQAWRTGIRTPKTGAAQQDFQEVIHLSNQSLATSGNYENYHEDKTTGLKYAHTINPHTGYPEKNTLLSASVFAENCATADAYATAFMAMGLDKAFELASQLPELEAYFIYSNEKGELEVKRTN